MTSSADLQVVSTLLAHGMILERGAQGRPSSSPSNTVLAARTSDAGCTNPNCKAKKRSMHTTANCYWPRGGKEGQFPPNFGQRAKANIASIPACTEEHFVLSAWTGVTFGESGVIIDGLDQDDDEDRPTAFISNNFKAFAGGKVPTFIDSGASDTMFVSRDAFVEYMPITSRTGDSANAEDGVF